MSDFLLELRSEEIPARMQAGARGELEKLFRREMDAAGVGIGEVTVWSTPRRLALVARGLPESTEAVREEAKGPPEGAPDAAIDGFCRKNGVGRDQLELREVKGRPTWFAVIEKPGRATRDLLAEAIPAIARDFAWPKSMRWGAASVSTGSLRWVRPLSGIVAILGEDLVECAVDGVRSGYATLGHRFHCPGEITIGGAHDYAEKLRACHVIVDHEERAALIREGARKAAADAGLALVEDEGLVIENAGLTEWPVPLLGRFDEAFLDVPPEVIQLTARTNQKYFVCTRAPAQAGASGEGEQPHEAPASAGTQELANAFVCTANIEAEDGGAAIVDGNRKVLAARLSDARFFWEQDRKTSLADHASKLERITFHEKLGTVADKVERVAKLARWLVEEGIVRESPLPLAGGAGGGPASSDSDIPSPNPSRKREGDLANLAEQAARLAKADLVTEMVGEFPELQGLMGGYYARAEGLPDEVADAIRDHYKPVGQGDEVPTAPVTVAVSLADKLDTVAAFFANDDKPTGSKDPYALRRAAISLAAVVAQNNLRIPLSVVYRATFLPARLNLRLDNSEVPKAQRAIDDDYFKSLDLFALRQAQEAENVFEIMEDRAHRVADPTKMKQFGRTRAQAILTEYESSEREFLDFFADRLKVQQREAGVRHDLIDAVFALGNEDDLVRLLARVNALQAFIETEDGANLLAAYKRASNILKKEDWRGIEGEIAQTGEEDPLAIVDDPDLAAVVAAKMAERHASGLSYTPEPAEKALIDALHAAEPEAARAVEQEDFAAAMAALASLRAPIDRFFDEVTVNADEEKKRAARLDLLARFRAAVHKVADFSRIEG
ncbi:glycine--tRNA ligase subunit beta [Pelagerythrobacter rhizovicinus]|uniref:Glycine--tRNA ligase beta subunit n=1 Tax=Pelagerythrobacter rhizovicinus TaxID=2268576 RepID=A0A4Q2KP88_9SPHN|nr:glycine--tRNA ligase subunit beta [Pelagerythrobacter rhizovicinus]RXZ66170.1 glycine--tRNA ligase subunit beta [Pelagerythrobacter rhizovicinus]